MASNSLNVPGNGQLITTDSPTGVWGWMKLPPELREMILRYVAYQEGGIHLLGRFGHDPYHPELSNISSILALNEDCRAVASRFFFAVNTLHYVRHLVLTNPMCEDCLMHILQYGLPRFDRLESLTLFKPTGWESEHCGGLAYAIRKNVPTIKVVTFTRIEKNGGMTLRSDCVITWD